MQPNPMFVSSLTRSLLHLTARRTVRSWTETPYDELTDAPTLTRSGVTNTVTGDLEGESWEQYLMMYRSQTSCSFVSLERFIGSLDGHRGSFVMQGTGTYEDGVARGTLTIVPGSGTDELTGLQGSGTFVAAEGRFSTIRLTCELLHTLVDNSPGL
ncbi:DUF3224 domain-containing protein [Spirosoma lacussanchae]|uniref:DUF3224 domain-containing protein n=1 Tax=Spirosoma lacussanchae TaxID=1884249 RepID=UPI001107D328|nr:DUF3224 domain-containing protein [Spirosoma lacussanchae]